MVAMNRKLHERSNKSNNHNSLSCGTLKLWTLRCSFLFLLLALCHRPSLLDVSSPQGTAADRVSTAPTKTTSELFTSKSEKGNEINGASIYDHNNNDHRNYTLLTLADFSDLSKQFPPKPEHMHDTWEQAVAKRRPIVKLLHRAGLHVDLPLLNHLIPTWQQVVDLYGPEPVVLGRHQCAAFRAAVPSPQRFVGVAGQMNVGTNALARYLRENLVMPDNPIFQGMLWTVPWWKHSWASLRNKYWYRIPDAHENVLPVIIIREPYMWMKSMCESPYSMAWNISASHCPNLIEESTLMDYDPGDGGANNDDGGDIPESLGIPVHIRWSKWGRTWPSLAHVWTSWYREYIHLGADPNTVDNKGNNHLINIYSNIESKKGKSKKGKNNNDYPRLFIRFEDMLFHTEYVLDEIRKCAGAEWKHDTFQFQVAPAKQVEYFERYKKQTGLVTALIKYGRATHRYSNMTDEDIEYSRQFLGSDLMELFHYAQPPDI